MIQKIEQKNTKNRIADPVTQWWRQRTFWPQRTRAHIISGACVFRNGRGKQQQQSRKTGQSQWSCGILACLSCQSNVHVSWRFSWWSNFKLTLSSKQRRVKYLLVVGWLFFVQRYYRVDGKGFFCIVKTWKIEFGVIQTFSPSAPPKRTSMLKSTSDFEAKWVVRVNAVDNFGRKLLDVLAFFPVLNILTVVGNS